MDVFLGGSQVTPSDWALWGMLGCLALGYHFGRRDGREEAETAYRLLRERFRLLAGRSCASDAAAVERLIRETRTP